MGKIIDKETGNILAEFDNDATGNELKQAFRKEGKSVKVEW